LGGSRVTCAPRTSSGKGASRGVWLGSLSQAWQGYKVEEAVNEALVLFRPVLVLFCHVSDYSRPDPTIALIERRRMNSA
ncbi:MAG TPA: hypothetical protein PLT86_09240, partial [Candidatus Latescibacteria bacterium]|nr:hypothetical protein [Candidatus Latescibacterota bacterium]